MSFCLARVIVIGSRDYLKLPKISRQRIQNKLLKCHVKSQVSEMNPLPKQELDTRQQPPKEEKETNKQQTNDIMTHLIHACEEMKKKNFTEFQDTKSIYQTHWLISQQYKLIACKNHKVGSTNIARVLYTLDHLSQQNDSNRIKTDRARQIVDIGNGEKRGGTLTTF